MRKALLLLLAVLVVTTTAFAGDPPARVARLSYLSGEVSIQPGGVNDWVQANINRPLTSSDRLWADNASRAELQMGGASLRVDNNTSMTLVNVSDSNVQVRVDQGTANLHVGELFDGDIYEIDTPNVAFIVRKKGDYRFDVDNAGDTTSVTVFRGEGDATGEGPMIRIKKEQRYTFTNMRSLQYTINNNPGLDGFDQWTIARAKLEDESASARYVSRYAVGYSDLDQYGGWVTVAPYGPVWYPRVVAGWAPYRYGHWVWVSPWGWTWVDDAPWGFAPFHYGRWVYYGSRWGWCPGPYHPRPVYAPALVGWFGGGGWGVSVSFGIGGGVGWFPLGWGEPYIPYYGHSRGYFQHVNVSNTRITNINYVTNNYYGDHHGKSWNYRYGHDAHAVTAVSNDTFRTSRPTRDGFMRLSDNDIKHARFESSVPVRPTTNSVLGPNAGQHRAAPPSDWKRPSRSERTTMTTDASPSRPDRVTQHDPVGRDAAANNGGDRRWENGQPNRGYARPGNPSTTAENERARGMPNNSVNSPVTDSASAMPSRVPRPPRGNDRPEREDRVQNNARMSRQDGASAPQTARVPAAEAPSASASRPDREDRPQSYARPTRQDTVAAPETTHVPAAEAPAARVPRPQQGDVVRPDRHQDSVSREERQPAPRTYENSRPQPQSQMREARPEAVTRPQAPPVREERPAPRVETSRPSEPPHAAPPPASKPAPERNNNPHVERKSQTENNQSSVRYPRPYGTVQPASYNSFASSTNNSTRTASDYTRQSYSRSANNSSMSTTPRASYSASNYSRPSSSQPRSYSQAYSSAPRSYSSSGISRSSSYSAPSHASTSSRSSGSSGHGSSHSSSDGSHGSFRSGKR